MSTRSACPACQRPVLIAPDLGGSLVRCPHCGHEYQTEFTPGQVSAMTAGPRIDRGRTALRFQFACRRCGSILEAIGSLCGRPGRCPTCGTVFIIPEVDQRTGVPLEPPSAAKEDEPPQPVHAYAAGGAAAPKIERMPDGSSQIICPRCKARSPIEADLCHSCGQPFTLEGATAVAGEIDAPGRWAGLSITVGALSCCIPVLGPVAIVFAGIALHRTRATPLSRTSRSPAMIGMLLGVVGTGLGVAMLAL